ncbi:MAG: DeoR family transcriptional regulator, partial [Staphylococcus lugdunensis]|nr:DeoR family transcriptional regulator [Staphylococcus lugdunensis]
CNAIKGSNVLTSTIDEAYTQQIALNHSVEKYLLIDDSKIDKEDFTQMCDLTELTAVIINQSDDEKIEKLKKYTEVIH